MRQMRDLMWKWAGTAELVRRREAEIAALMGAIADAYDTRGAARLTGLAAGKGGESVVERALELAQERAEIYQRRCGDIREELVEAMRLCGAIDRLVAELTMDERRVIELRYRDALPWLVIASRLRFDERHVKRLEFAAIQKLSRNVTFSAVQ